VEKGASETHGVQRIATRMPDGRVQERLDFSAREQEILELIRSLPEAYRETLVLRLVEGMTGPEIAYRTGLTPESVRVNLCRGMKMLREKIEGRTYE